MHRAHQIFNQYGAMRQAFLIFTVETHRGEAIIWAIDITVLRFEGGYGLLINSPHLLFPNLLSYHFEISSHLFKGPFHLQVLLLVLGPLPVEKFDLLVEGFHFL